MEVTIFSAKLPCGVVAFKELTVGEFEAAMRISKESGLGTGQDWELTNECLRRSIVEVGGSPVRWADLAGEQLAHRLGGLKGLMLARDVWSRIHAPSAAEVAEAGELKVTVRAT